MKFVHLTPQPYIARVKRNGIHFGDGRRGRGVYAVPLMLMQCGSFMDNDRVVPAEPRSTITLWQWLATLRHRHRNLAAIIFRTTQEHWPAQLHIELKPAIGTDWLSELDEDHASVDDADLQFVQDAHDQGFIADLKISTHNTKGLGKVLHTIQSRGHTTWDRYDESIEIVFPSPITPNLIERVTPLYRTNKQFKYDRKRKGG